MPSTQQLNDKAAVGNSISSSKEDFIVQLLKEKNLERVNRETEKVVPNKGIYANGLKRVFDLLIGLVAFIIVLPINLILGICTFFDVGHPIFFRQTRIGKDGKMIQIIKFRNMTNATDEEGNLLPASQRVTKFGKFVRKFSLDELLNFWSVIKGDMSIIGPRPLPTLFADRYSERHWMRHAVRPGLECPRIIKDEGLSKYHTQFENDVWYVENISFKTDCYLIWQLVKMVFNIKYRSKGASAASYFVGYDENNNATSLSKVCREHPEYDELYNKMLDGYIDDQE